MLSKILRVLAKWAAFPELSLNTVFLNSNQVIKVHFSMRFQQFKVKKDKSKIRSNKLFQLQTNVYQIRNLCFNYVTKKSMLSQSTTTKDFQTKQDLVLCQLNFRKLIFQLLSTRK